MENKLLSRKRGRPTLYDIEDPVKTTINLPRQMKELLEQEASESGKTVSDLMREIFAKHLENNK